MSKYTWNEDGEVWLDGSDDRVCLTQWPDDAKGLAETLNLMTATIDTLTAQLAAANAQVAERDAVLGALGFDEKQFRLMADYRGAGKASALVIDGKLLLAVFANKAESVLPHIEINLAAFTAARAAGGGE